MPDYFGANLQPQERAAVPDNPAAKKTREARPPRRPRPAPPPPALVARAALALPADSVVLAHLRSDATIEPLIRDRRHSRITTSSSPPALA